MPSIYLAANYVMTSGWLRFFGHTPYNSDQWLHYQTGHLSDSGHLQVVYGDMELEVQAPRHYGFGGDWQYKYQNHYDETPFVQKDGPYSYSYDPNNYAHVPITLREGQTEDDVWQLLRNIHGSMEEHGSDIDYNISTQDSNSYVNTMLHAIGIDLQPYLPSVTPPNVDVFPGHEMNVLMKTDDGRAIKLEVAGTDGNYYLQGGRGSDIFYASVGSDTLIGGWGIDMLNLPEEGESLADNEVDYLEGGDGFDFYYTTPTPGIGSLTALWALRT